MSNIDLEFVCSIFDGGYQALTSAIQSNVSKDILLEPYDAIYEFIREHFIKYGNIPSIETVHERFDEFYEEPSESTAYYVDELKNRQKLKLAAKLARQIMNAVNSATKPEEVKKVVSKIESHLYETIGAYSVDLSEATMTDITLNTEVRMARLEKIRRKDPDVMGMPFPWEPLNEELYGAQDGDFITVIGKSGLGKTWTMLNMLTHAHGLGNKTLLFTAEMTIAQLAYRFDSLMFQIPYKQLKRPSEMTELEMAQYRASLKALERKRKEGAMEPFFINQGAQRIGIKALAAIARLVKPKVIGIDGAYLFSDSFEWSKIAEMTAFLKYLALQLGCVIIVTNQITKSKTSNTDSAFSSSFYNDASIVIKIYQDEEKTQLPFMNYKITKGRDLSTKNLKWTCNHNFEEMDFRYRPDLYPEDEEDD